MSLEKHFEGYRHFVKLDVLDGYVDYVNSEVYVGGETMAQKLGKLKHGIELEAARGNKIEYNELLKDHQGMLLYAFRNMAKIKYNEYINSGKAAELAILDIAHLGGWNWFKFLHDVEITFDKLVIVPMHKEGPIYKELPVFDADEMKVIMDNPVSEKQAENILHLKMNAQKKGITLKLYVSKDFGGDPHFHDLSTINKLSVVDWTREVAYVQ